jgi:uncharacterized phage protein gp47/JayE
MKSLTEIKRNLVSFYSSIQGEITDFSVGSVVSGLFYSFSAALESAYSEITNVSTQAYVSTATGQYLDRIIDGTFQLKRTPPTRATGYVVIYANSPLPDPASIRLRYADYNYETGEFVSGLQSATKFIGFNEQGQDGIVYTLITPLNKEFIDSTNRLIILNRSVQFLVLPVASVLRGSLVRVKEGGIYSFPSPPPGISGVLNTSNPGAVFFSSRQSISGAPFYSRFTEILSYNNSSSNLSVLNAYNFSKTGVLEITGNVSQSKPIVATYTQNPDGTGDVRQGGLVFDYIDASTSSITLSLPLSDPNQVPKIVTVSGGDVITLTLHSFTYDGVTYQNVYNGEFNQTIHAFIEAKISDGLRLQQKADQINDALIFDPDSVVTSSYRLVESANISGGTDGATDEEYREALRKYLAGLSRATIPSLEAGALQVPGVSFAKTLPANISPRGSAIVLASDDSGQLPPGLKRQVKSTLDEFWKAAGVNVIVRSPTLLRVHTTMNVVLEPGVFKTSASQQITAVVDEYLRSKDPGDELKYSEVLSAISSVPGVSNVFNLILSKQLTSDSYLTNKGQYDEAILLAASTSGQIETLTLDPDVEFSAENLGTAINFNQGYIVVATDLETAEGILYNIIDGTGEGEVIFGDAEVLSELYQSLVVNPDTITAEKFYDAVLEWFDAFGATEDEAMYKLSYLMSEPLQEQPLNNYPINPLLINYDFIRDYPSASTEIFRPNTFILGTGSKTVVGINYL